MTLILTGIALCTMAQPTWFVLPDFDAEYKHNLEEGTTTRVFRLKDGETTYYGWDDSVSVPDPDADPEERRDPVQRIQIDDPTGSLSTPTYKNVGAEEIESKRIEFPQDRESRYRDELDKQGYRVEEMPNGRLMAVRKDEAQWADEAARMAEETNTQQEANLLEYLRERHPPEDTAASLTDAPEDASSEPAAPGAGRRLLQLVVALATIALVVALVKLLILPKSA